MSSTFVNCKILKPFLLAHVPGYYKEPRVQWFVTWFLQLLLRMLPSSHAVLHSFLHLMKTIFWPSWLKVLVKHALLSLHLVFYQPTFGPFLQQQKSLIFSCPFSVSQVEKHQMVLRQRTTKVVNADPGAQISDKMQ